MNTPEITSLCIEGELIAFGRTIKEADSDSKITK